MSDYYQAPRWTGEILDCSLPVAMDTYNLCSYKCAYCFSQFQKSGVNKRASKNFYNEHIVRTVDVNRVKKLFAGDIEDKQFSAWIKDKRPIQYGALADQFDENERKMGCTLEILKTLCDNNYPVSFSTKAAWFTQDERYMELIKKQAENWNFKISIITLDEKKARLIERGVPSPAERLKAMKVLAEAGASVTLRLRPFILGVSDKTYLDLIEAAKEAGAQALSTEFLCLDIRGKGFEYTAKCYDVLNSVCGFDIIDFYKKNSTTQGYMRLNRSIKRPYVKRMKELCDRIGMRFYCSDAMFKELSHNCCCCGLPDSWKFSRGNFSTAIQIAKTSGEVHFSDIAKELKQYTGHYKWRNNHGFNKGTAEKNTRFHEFSMYDYVHYCWNEKKLEKMFDGILIAAGTDNNGDVVYKYNRVVSC